MQPNETSRSKPSQTPGVSDEQARETAKSAIDKLAFDEASVVVLGLVRLGISQKARYDIINDYASKFKGRALDKFVKEATDMGFLYVDPVSFQNARSDIYAYMKTISYGIALFGEKGLQEAIGLVLKGKDIRDSSKKGLPIIYRLAAASAEFIRMNNLVASEKASSMLSRAILDSNTPIQEQDILARWAFDIDPAIACKLRDAASNPATRDLMNGHIQTTLKGKVSC